MARSATSSHSAYIIHVRPYRETSVQLELLCHDLGRIAAIYKGGRKSTKNRTRPEQFVHYHASLFGNGEMKSVASLEVDQDFERPRLQGVQLFSAMYINELLYKALPRNVLHADIFLAYQDVLLALRSTGNFEAHLRHFELRVLASLGYGLSFELESDGHTPIDASLSYQFEAGRGFSVLRPNELTPELNKSAQLQSGRPPVVDGQVLRKIAAGEWREETVLKTLKRINQVAINDLLKGKPIKSRELLRKSTRSLS